MTTPSAEAFTQDWQAVLAPIIVGLVVIGFIARRLMRVKKSSLGCGTACDCSLKPKAK